MHHLDYIHLCIILYLSCISVFSVHNSIKLTITITVYNLPHLTTVAWFDSHLIEFHSLGASSEDDVVIGSLHLLILLMEIT